MICLKVFLQSTSSIKNVFEKKSIFYSTQMSYDLKNNLIYKSRKYYFL